MAGDFNAPISSDRRGSRVHAENVARLAGLGLTNAFGAARGDQFDPLDEPTLYHRRKEGDGFHIDHAFIPKPWASDLRVTVGSFAEWVATGRSDHVPVIVDLPSIGM